MRTVLLQGDCLYTEWAVLGCFVVMEFGELWMDGMGWDDVGVASHMHLHLFI